MRFFPYICARAAACGRKRDSKLQWTSYPHPAPIQDMGIDHCRRNVLVSEEFLNRPDVVAIHKEVSSKAVTERMTTDMFCNSRQRFRPLHRALQRCRMKVMASNDPAHRISGKGSSREEPEPCPFFSDIFVFPVQSKRDGNSGIFFGAIPLIQETDPVEMFPEI